MRLLETRKGKIINNIQFGYYQINLFKLIKERTFNAIVIGFNGIKFLKLAIHFNLKHSYISRKLNNFIQVTEQSAAYDPRVKLITDNYLKQARLNLTVNKLNVKYKAITPKTTECCLCVKRQIPATNTAICQNEPQANMPPACEELCSQVELRHGC